jgi:hypothetical protein
MIALMRLMVEVGEGCQRIMDEKMRDLPCKRIQVDEIWSYVRKKQNHLKPGESVRAGDFWTWVTGTEKTVIIGGPDQRHISTSHVERQNLTMRMQMRHLTRLTNGFSKKVENLKAAVSLHFCHYNFVRLHKSLRITSAMAAGFLIGCGGIGRADFKVRPEADGWYGQIQ